jgi:NADH dehydrogenase
VRTGERVASVSPTRVVLHSGEELKAHTLVWGAGLQGSPVAQLLGVELARGHRLPAESDLRLAGHPEVFVVGDAAAIEDTDRKPEKSEKPDEHGHPPAVLPQLGSVALQSGEHAGETIARLLEGKKTTDFAYHDKGTMAAIGRGAACVQFHGGETMTGRKAQLAWLTVHLALLPTNEDRAKALVDWAGATLTHERAGRFIVEDA